MIKSIKKGWLFLILMSFISFTVAQPANITIPPQTNVVGPLQSAQPVVIAPAPTLPVPTVTTPTVAVPVKPISPPVAVAPPPPSSSPAAQRMSVTQFRDWVQKNANPSVPKANLIPKNNNTATLPALIPVAKPLPKVVHKVRRQKSRPYTFAQGQQAMLQSVPPTSRPPSEDSVIAFNGLLQQNMPLSPQQVVKLRQQIDIAQRAAAVPPNIPPKPVSNTLMINLAPGTTPPVIRLAQGYVTSLVFVDSTGSPWPIAAFDIGNPKSVMIQWDGKSNIILIQALSPYSDGNMVIRLIGLPTPITLEIVAGQRRVDYRVDIHVPGIGPNTKELPIESAIPNGANELLLSVLDGVAPPGSKQLSVLGMDAQAWLLGERMYFRTRLTVLSPGWIGKMVSPDGMNAYELPRTSSILISRYGEPTEIRIEGL